MSYRIVPRDGQFELYINGKFYCYGNTWAKVSMELDRARYNKKENYYDRH